jgi:hypothetical protein
MGYKALVIILMIFSGVDTFCQPLQNNGKDQTVSFSISVKKVRAAVTMEDLISVFPREKYQIVSCNITIMGKGKDLFVMEYTRSNHKLSETLSPNTRIGNKIYLDLVRVKKLPDGDSLIKWVSYQITIVDEAESKTISIDSLRKVEYLEDLLGSFPKNDYYISHCYITRSDKESQANTTEWNGDEIRITSKQQTQNQLRVPLIRDLFSSEDPPKPNQKFVFDWILIKKTR